MSFDACREIDDHFIKVISLYEHYEASREQLQEYLRRGFIGLAQIRYTKGQQAVPLWKIPNEIHAKIGVARSTDSTDLNDWSIDIVPIDNNNIQRSNFVRSSGLRNEILLAEAKPLKSHMDPIYWFGSHLVGALKDIQFDFKQVVNECCQLAVLVERIDFHLNQISLLKQQLNKQSLI